MSAKQRSVNNFEALWLCRVHSLRSTNSSFRSNSDTCNSLFEKPNFSSSSLRCWLVGLLSSNDSISCVVARAFLISAFFFIPTLLWAWVVPNGSFGLPIGFFFLYFSRNLRIQVFISKPILYISLLVFVVSPLPCTTTGCAGKSTYSQPSPSPCSISQQSPSTRSYSLTEKLPKLTDDFLGRLNIVRFKLMLVTKLMASLRTLGRWLSRFLVSPRWFLLLPLWSRQASSPDDSVGDFGVFRFNIAECEISGCVDSLLRTFMDTIEWMPLR